MGEPEAAHQSIQTELDRHLFHLRTLCDISRDLLGIRKVKEILRHFLFMTTGNFGVVEGFLLIQELSSGEIGPLVSIGFGEEDQPRLMAYAGEIFSRAMNDVVILDGAELPREADLSNGIALVVPFRVDDSCRGVLGLGHKIVGEPYNADDEDLLVTLVNNVVIALKNARYAEALEEAYGEVSSLNRAKDKVINHLSHELKTPISLLSASIRLLERKLLPLSDNSWERTLERAKRNLDRLMAIQDEVEDIMYGIDLKTHSMLNFLLDQCADELEILAAEKLGEGPIVDQLRSRVEEIFGPKDAHAEDIRIDAFAGKMLASMTPLFSHRKVKVETFLEPAPPVNIPPEVLEKMINGLVKNAIENTPDGGTVEVEVKKKGKEIHLIVQDHGVGITEEHQKRIFEGFFPTQETEAYASREPFDFNAGGKGADLLRMKIFSERYHFRMQMMSERCRHIADGQDECPGDIGRCTHCHSVSDCMKSGGTVFTTSYAAREI